MRVRLGFNMALALVALFPSWAAADLVPLSIRPVSVSMSAGGTTANGTSTATASGSFSNGSGSGGGVSASVTTLGDRIRVEATGDLSDAGTESVGAATSAEVEVEFDVPDIGDAVTPVFFSFANVTSSGVWQPPQITAGVSAFSAFTSSQLGEIILPEGFAYPYVAAIRLGPQPFSSFLSLPPGDVVRFRTRIQLNHHQSPPLVLGAFAASAELVLRVPTPTIGTGDVNGDRNLDLLDVTLIRRALAGLDPWP